LTPGCVYCRIFDNDFNEVASHCFANTSAYLCDEPYSYTPIGGAAIIMKNTCPASLPVIIREFLRLYFQNGLGEAAFRQIFADVLNDLNDNDEDKLLTADDFIIFDYTDLSGQSMSKKALEHGLALRDVPAGTTTVLNVYSVTPHPTTYPDSEILRDLGNVFKTNPQAFGEAGPLGEPQLITNPDSASSGTATKNGGGSDINMSDGALAAIIIGSILAGVAILALIYFLARKRGVFHWEKSQPLPFRSPAASYRP